MAQSSEDHLIGRRIGAYEIVSVLGQGGMGVVFRARQVSLQRDVALKLLRGGDRSEEGRLRFEQEARVVARLEHPGIPGIFDAGEHVGSAWYAMPIIEGRSLEAALAEGLEPVELARLLAQVADSLDYVHEQGLIHRDVKPSNILIDTMGRTQLMDFGLVKDTTRGRVTVEGAILGTPTYMSPEQANGELDRVDGRTDIYALGATLYLALADLLHDHSAARRRTPRLLLRRGRVRNADRRPLGDGQARQEPGPGRDLDGR